MNGRFVAIRVSLPGRAYRRQSLHTRPTEGEVHSRLTAAGQVVRPPNYIRQRNLSLLVCEETDRCTSSSGQSTAMSQTTGRATFARLGHHPTLVQVPPPLTTDCKGFEGLDYILISACPLGVFRASSTRWRLGSGSSLRRLSSTTSSATAKLLRWGPFSSDEVNVPGLGFLWRGAPLHFAT